MILVAIVIILGILFPQELPQDFFSYINHKLKINAGESWDRHSTFGPARISNIDSSSSIESEYLYIASRFGSNLTHTNNNDFGKSLYGYINFLYSIW